VPATVLTLLLLSLFCPPSRARPSVPALENNIISFIKPCLGSLQIPWARLESQQHTCNIWHHLWLSIFMAMARSKLIFLSAIFACVSSSPLFPQDQHQGDEIVLSNPAGPTLTAISSPGTAPLLVAEPPSRPRPALVEPSQTAAIPIAIPIHARLDILPAPTPIADPALESGAGQACTTTLSEKVVSPCFWDGTRTIYPYSTTRYTSVDCHGCGQINVVKDWYHCPNMRINATQVVSTPSTYWTTVCEASTVLAAVKQRDTAATPTADGPLITTRPGAAEIQARPRKGRERNPQLDNAPCPTTFVIQPEKSAGKTSTRYSKYTTTTILLNCAGCPLFLSTALAGYGPANGFTKTTTLPVGTTTTYACYY